MFFDNVEAQLMAQYQQDKLIRQMQDSKADTDFLMTLVQRATKAIRNQLPSVSKERRGPVIGDVQTSAR